LVEIKTGEEGEVVLFKQRCKLYRFDKDTNEFKERGLGDLKILMSESDGKVRIIMRREQTMKLCANHSLTSTLVLKAMAKSDRAFTWQCHDFSENELKVETLAARFKTPQLAEEFKSVFESSVIQSSEDKVDCSKPASAQSAMKPAANGFGDQFKPKVGSWSCPTCTVTNTSDKHVCPCCGTGKDSSTPKPSAVNYSFSSPNGNPSFFGNERGFSYRFGSPTTGQSIFGNTPAKIPDAKSS